MRDRGAEWQSSRPMHVSFLDRMPLSHSRPNLYLPLIPAAVESFDFRGFDMVISFNASWAKGVLVPPETRHLCRSFLPMRYAWESFHDFMALGLPVERSSWLSKKLRGHVMSHLRMWDVVTANRVDDFVANSKYVAGIIRRRYRREVSVVYPPVDTGFFFPDPGPIGDYYLIVSRLTPYKRVDLAVEAFNRLGLALVVVGNGTQRKALEQKGGPNVKFLGNVDRTRLRSLYQNCRGFVMPQIEDFGIAAVEAMACGRPVIVCGAGGALETVQPERTGVLFWPQTTESLAEAVTRAEAVTFLSTEIRQQAERFTVARFQHEMLVHLLGQAEALHTETAR